MKHCEPTFALLILVAVPSINYLIPYKLVFLNIFFIVILIAAYHLRAHKAILGGMLATLLCVIYVYHFPQSFTPVFNRLDLWMNVVAWSRFLILTAGVVGSLVDRLKTQVEQIETLKQDLAVHLEELEILITQLMTD
jgi:Na+/proline symporter